MKKFLLGTVGLFALGMVTPASAADLAARPYTKAPPPIVAPIYDWTGFYIGANGGWAQSRNCVDFFNATGIDFADGCRERSGGVVGGQLGYRWQASQWVFGVEAQGDWADLSNTRVSIINPLFSTRTKTDGIGLFTGQIGYAWNASLFYVKGGAAVTDNRFSILSAVTGAEAFAAGRRGRRLGAQPEGGRRVPCPRGRAPPRATRARPARRFRAILPWSLPRRRAKEAEEVCRAASIPGLRPCP